MNINFSAITNWPKESKVLSFIVDIFIMFRAGFLCASMVFCAAYLIYGIKYEPTDIIKKNSLIVKTTSASLSEAQKKYDLSYGDLNFVKLTFEQNSEWPKLETNSSDKYASKESFTNNKQRLE